MAVGNWTSAFMQAQGLEPSILSHSADISSGKLWLQWQQALEPLLEPAVIKHSVAMSTCEQRASI